MPTRRHNVRDPRTGRFISVQEAVQRQATGVPFRGRLLSTPVVEAARSLEDVREEWLELATQALIDELREGDHVHVISGDLKAGFYSTQPGLILNDQPYAVNEFTREGVREFGDIREGDIGGATPHNPFPSAWQAILPDITEILQRAMEENVKLPTLRIDAGVYLPREEQGVPNIGRRVFGTAPSRRRS